MFAFCFCKKNNDGTSLIEIMIVVAIILSVVFTAAPIFNWMRQQGLGHAVDQMRSDLNMLRLEAIRKSEICTIQFNYPAQGCYQDLKTRHTVELSHYRGGVRFLTTGPDGRTMTDRVGFNRRGMSTSVVPANIFVTDESGSKVYRLRIMLAGGITINSWNGQQWR